MLWETTPRNLFGAASDSRSWLDGGVTNPNRVEICLILLLDPLVHLLVLCFAYARTNMRVLSPLRSI